MCNYECESTIILESNKQSFLSIEPERVETIFFYKFKVPEKVGELECLPVNLKLKLLDATPGIFRLKNQVYEYKKRIKTYRRYYSTHNNEIILLTRSVAVEVPLKISKLPDSQFIHSIKTRKIIREVGGYRLSINCTSHSKMSSDVEYTFEIETEYNKSIMEGRNIEVLRGKELFMINLIKNYENLFTYPKISFNFEDCINIPSKVFGNIITFNKKNAKYVHKWDGYKGRVVSNNTTTYLSLDVGEGISAEKKSIPFVPNVWYQIEVLTSRIIITDILGVRHGGVMWGTDPLYALLELGQLECKGKLKGLPVRPQRILSSPNEKAAGTDGKIAISNNLLYKIKLPTFDLVLCSGKLSYDRNIILFNSIEDTKTKGVIVEVDLQVKPGIELPIEKFRHGVPQDLGAYFDYNILRRRHDRKTPMSKDEFHGLLKQLIYIITHVNLEDQ